MILLLHNRYRHPGGEERAIDDMRWLIETRLGEGTALLERDSSRLSGLAAAAGLVGGGLRPRVVADAVRACDARIVHAHNVHPSLGHRALAAAREAGARVVLHLHNYRLVCAVGTCFTAGADCTRCHGRNTLPGLRLNCRSASRVEALAYAAGLALQQRRLVEQVDAFVVPSQSAVARLRALGAPIGDRVHVLPSAQRAFAERSRAADGSFALVAGRIAPGKGVGDAIEGCARAGVPLVVAGDGPEAPALRERAAGRDVRFVGRVPPAELDALRRDAALALVPSHNAEVFPLSAAESMAAGLPAVAASAGGLADFVPREGLYPAGDVAALAERIGALYANAEAGERALARAREVTAPEQVAERLGAVYEEVCAAGP